MRSSVPSPYAIRLVGGEVAQAFESAALLALDRRLGVRLEEIIAPSPEVTERIGAANSVQVADLAPPIDEVQQRLGYHLSQ